MTVDILNIQGEKTGKTIELPENIFGVEPNEHVVYLAVKQYLANQRQGTHKTKERGEVKGSTKKIKRQKGTGTARAGDIKNPTFRGGGRMFGPKPRNYSLKLNKKVRRLARKVALSSKASDNGIIVIEDFSFDAPKTKEYINILRRLNVADQKTVFVTADLEKEVYLSGRNYPKSSVVQAKSLNTYQILNANTIVLSEGAVNKIAETLV